MATRVRLLRERDFDLDKKTLVTLDYDDTILVLFDDGTDKALTLRNTIIAAAETTSGPVFAICDIKTQYGIAAAFDRLKNLPNHPLIWAAGAFPYILVYRDGWPQAIVNIQNPTPQGLSAYASILAGQPTYFEKYFVNADGTAVANKSVIMEPVNLKPNPSAPVPFSAVPIPVAPATNVSSSSGALPVSAPANTIPVIANVNTSNNTQSRVVKKVNR